MADDQGWGDVGYNGHPYLKTPNLDSMAKMGLFSQGSIQQVQSAHLPEQVS